MAKGSEFEREFAKRLGVWWGGRDDIFWRSSNSGGRATVRRAGGLATAGQAGDIAATDPVGQPLVDLITFELKKGYSKANETIHHHMDKQARHGATQFELFIEQAATAARNAPSQTWAVIWQRHGRTAWIWLPEEFAKDMRRFGAWAGAPHPRATITDKFKGAGGHVHWEGAIMGFPWSEWEEKALPVGLRAMAEMYT